jgi:hypothetical protein
MKKNFHRKKRKEDSGEAVKLSPCLELGENSKSKFSQVFAIDDYD